MKINLVPVLTETWLVPTAHSEEIRLRLDNDGALTPDRYGNIQFAETTEWTIMEVARGSNPHSYSRLRTIETGTDKSALVAKYPDAKYMPECMYADGGYRYSSLFRPPAPPAGYESWSDVPVSELKRLAGIA